MPTSGHGRQRRSLVASRDRLDRLVVGATPCGPGRGHRKPVETSTCASSPHCLSAASARIACRARTHDRNLRHYCISPKGSCKARPRGASGARHYAFCNQFRLREKISVDRVCGAPGAWLLGLFSRVSTSLEDGRPHGANQRDNAARRLELLESFEAAGLGCFWATDDAGRVTYLTNTALQKIGRDIEELLGRQLTELFASPTADAEDGPERPLSFLPVPATRSRPWQYRSRAPGTKPGGRYRASRNTTPRSASLAIAAARRTSRCCANGSGRPRLWRAAIRLPASPTASHGEPSRRTLDAYRNAKRSCALMMMDLDRFKQVNDTLGHPRGTSCKAGRGAARQRGRQAWDHRAGWGATSS